MDRFDKYSVGQWIALLFISSMLITGCVMNFGTGEGRIDVLSANGTDATGAEINNEESD